MHFVLRSPYAGPSTKHQVKRPGSVLEWFQHAFRETETNEPYAWLQRELGAQVYGLSSVFEKRNELGLAVPSSWKQLGSLLREHLYVEGEMKLSEHAVRVLTNDDEVELAYYFFDDDWIRQNPERDAFLRHERFPLPVEVSKKSSFEPRVKMKSLAPSGKGEGATYGAFLTFYDGGGLDDFDLPRRVRVLRGVRFPELANHLRKAKPRESWPVELVMLRSQLGTGGLDEALQRLDKINLLALGVEELDGLFGSVEGARKAVKELVPEPKKRAARATSTFQNAEHVVQAGFGFPLGEVYWHRWILFDDLWASANADLANGILEFASRWDPLR